MTYTRGFECKIISDVNLHQNGSVFGEENKNITRKRYAL